MKLQFTTQDSIYHIFKTIKKIPSYRAADIFIPAEHEFFKHTRWGDQVMEIVNNQHLQLTFLVDNKEADRYFQQIGATTQWQKSSGLVRLAQQAYTILFATRTLHNQLVLKKNYLSYLVIIAEISVIIALLYGLWGFVSPNATITIKPSYHIEDIIYNYRYYPEDLQIAELAGFINIPYQDGTIPFEHTMTLNVQNVTYELTQARGTLKVINNLPQSFSLLDRTKFETLDGVVFAATKYFSVPAATDNGPGIAFIDVEALEYQENGEMIGERGNIDAGTVLAIQKLPESRDQGAVYAEAVYDFQGGSTEAKGTVIAADIEKIEAQIIEFMEDGLKEKLVEAFPREQGYILMFDELISLEIEEFITTSTVGEVTAFIEGKVRAKIHFPYVSWTSIQDAVNLYLRQRPSENFTLLNFDHNSLTFYELIPHDYLTGVYLIPTRLNVVWGYNFLQDSNDLLAAAKSRISGTSVTEATNILTSYDEIDQADIAISPPWYDTLPNVTARIQFRVSTTE